MRKLIVIFIAAVFLLSVDDLHGQERSNGQRNQDSLYTYATATSGGTGKLYLGREIAHVMGSANAGWLDRASRPNEEQTQRAIDRIKIAPSGVIADVGAGTGYYTFKLARIVPQGKVIAVELQDDMISALKARKKQLNNKNVEVVKGSTKAANLPANSIDLAILVDVYHELEFPVEMLQSIRKALKKDGRLLLIEYKGEDPAVAIRPLHKTTVAQLTKELAANGFKMDFEGKFMPIQHFLTFKKVD